MAELNVPIFDFRHGVLTPKLKDRPNLDIYKSGVLVGENFLTQIHGPTQFRPGFIFSRTTRRNNIPHFIPFTFADDEAYTLSFTDLWLRWFTDSGLGTDPGVLTETPIAISGITQADPGVVTAVGHDYVNGDEVFIEGCVGMTEVNGQFFLVAGAVVPGTSERNWPYSVPGNYTYNSSLIEVTAGEAILKLLGGSADYPFTTSGNYTFDSSWVEVTGGDAQLTGLGLPAYGHWKLNESSGTLAADSSINGRDGTTVNMENADWVPAKLNNGLIFDGVDEYVTFGDIANFERTDTFSIEFWFNTTTAGAEMIMSRQLNSGTFRGWNVFIESGVITTALISNNGTVNRIQRKTNAVYNSGVWHHCVVTYDGSSDVSGLIIYINGSAVATTVVTNNLSATIVNAADCQLSGREGANVVYTGTADEVAIYDVVLSAANVTARYNSGTGTELMQYAYAKPIVNNTGFVFSFAVNLFTETATKPGSDDIKYQVSSDDGVTWKWWSGAAWVAITGAMTDTWYYDNEVNSAATVNTNIGSLAVSGTFKFRAFLHSSDGTTTPQLDNILVGNIAYSTTDPTIESNSGFPFTAALEDFTETATKPASTEIQYIVSVDNGVVFLYWSGAAWVTSNGTYAQSNTAAVIDTNIAALGASGTFTYKAFLHTSDATATPELDNIHTQFTVAATNTFELTDQDGNDVDTSGFGAYIGSGTVARVYEIESPYLTADLPQLKFAQKADIMYIDHPSYLPRKLTRFGSGAWTLTTYVRTNDPFNQIEISNITQANPAQVTTTTDHGFSTGNEVLIEDVTGMTQVNHEIFTVTKIDNLNYTLGVDSSAYDAYVSGGACILDGDAPATVGFYGGRVFHGGSVNDPDGLFGSRSPDTDTGATRYEDFTVGAEPDDAIYYALTSVSNSTVDRVRFFQGTRSFLAVGTFAGLLKVNGGSDAVPLSSDAVESFPVDSFGVADIMPVEFGTDIIYIQRGGGVAYSFRYSLLNDGYKSEDETLQSDEITKGGIKQITYQQGRPNQVWAVTNIGDILSFVYNNTESISAWNKHIIAGDGTVLTASAQPQEDNEDRLWIGVERLIDGIIRRYVEYQAKNPIMPQIDDFYTDPNNKEADTDKFKNLMFYAQKRQVHMDSALALDTTQTATVTPAAVTGDSISFATNISIFSSLDIGRRIQVKYLLGTEAGIAEIVEYVSGTEVLCNIKQDFLTTDTIASGGWYFTQDTISGINHLEGETIGVVTDGGIHPDETVVNGSITLNYQTTYAMVGERYLGRVKTMPLELLLSTGITPGKLKTVNKVNLMFRNTLGVSYGTDPYNLQKIGFRDGEQHTDRPPLPFNGAKEQPGFDSSGEQRHMWLIQTVPYPCTLGSMVMDMDVNPES